MSDIYYIVVPIVVVVVILKLCLIFWRVWVYQKRREQRAYIVQQQRVAVAAATRPSARVVRVQRVCGPGGIAQQTSYAVDQPGQPTRIVTRTVVLRPAPDGRPLDPNLPPTYEAAVSGRDRSVKVEDGKINEPVPPAPSAPPPAFSDEPPPPPPPSNVTMAPPYQAVATPAPSAPEIDSDDIIEADSRTRLLA